MDDILDLFLRSIGVEIFEELSGNAAIKNG